MNKVVEERILSARNYAGSILHTKEQTIVVSSKDTRCVKNIATGYTYFTLCTILTYYKRVVEERARVKGLFLEHKDCKRTFVKEKVIPPKNCILSDVQPIDFEIKEKKEKPFKTERNLLANGQCVFINNQLVNPIKFKMKGE